MANYCLFYILLPKNLPYVKKVMKMSTTKFKKVLELKHCYSLIFQLTSYVDAHGRDFLQHNAFAKEPLGGKTDLPPLVPSPATALLGLLLLSALNRNILPPAPSAPSPPAQVPNNFTSEQVS